MSALRNCRPTMYQSRAASKTGITDFKPTEEVILVSSQYNDHLCSYMDSNYLENLCYRKTASIKWNALEGRRKRSIMKSQWLTRIRHLIDNIMRTLYVLITRKKCWFESKISTTFCISNFLHMMLWYQHTYTLRMATLVYFVCTMGLLVFIMIYTNLPECEQVWLPLFQCYCCTQWNHKVC